MTRALHSAGPWEAKGQQIVSADGGIVAVVNSRYSASVQLANANVIAAAPLLVDTGVDAAGCLAACAGIMRECGNPKTAALALRYHDALLAAIKQAIGGEL